MKVHNFTGENAIKDAMDYAMRFAEKNNTPFNQELFDSLVSKGYITIDGKNPYEESMEDLEGGNMVDVEGGEVEGDNVEGSPDKVYHDYNAESTSGNSDDESLPETIRNVNRIREITSEYEKLYKQKRDILLNRVKVNGKYSDEDIAKLNDIDNKLGAIEDSDELATLLAPIADGDYVASDLKGTKYLIDDAMHGNFVNTLIGILNKAGTSKSKKSDLAGANWYDNIGLGSGMANFNKDMLGEDVYNHNKAAGKVNSILEVAKRYADKKAETPNESDEDTAVQANTEGSATKDNSPKTLSFGYGEDIYNMQGDKNAYLNKRDLSTAVAMSRQNKVSDEDIWEYLNQNEKFVNAKEEDKQRTFERVKSKIEEVSNKNKKKEDEVKKEDEAKKEDEIKTEETPANTEIETPADTETETSIETEEESIPMNEDTLNLSRDVSLKKGDKDADYRQYDYDKLRKYIDKKAKDDYNTWLHEPNAKRTITLSDAEKEKMKNDIRQSVIKQVSQLYKLPINEDTLNGVGDNEKQIDEETLQKMIDKKAKKDYNTWLHEPNAKRTITLTNDEKNKMKDDIHTSVTKELSQLYKVPMNEDTLNGSGDVETVVTEKKPVTKTETKKTNTNKTGKKISMNDIMSWTKNILRGGK